MKEKNTVIVDVDGVLADHISSLQKYLKDYYNVKIEKDYIDEWDTQIEMVDKDFITLYREMSEEDKKEKYFGNCPVIDGSIEALNELNNQDVFIKIVTHRADELTDITKKWLSDNNIPYDKYIKEDYENSKSIRNGGIIIDDYVKNIEDFINDGRDGILFHHWYNKEKYKNYPINCLHERHLHLPNHHTSKSKETLIRNTKEQWETILKIIKQKFN